MMPAVPPKVAGANGPERRPRSLIVSFFGAYGRELGGWVAVADLVRLMSQVDVDEQATRMAVSRLKQRGWVRAERAGGQAGYTLSESAREILAEGDQRIYRRRVADPADGWVLVVFSVPESERKKRHVLRAELTRLGFGSTASGVWIAPAHLHDETSATLRRLGLTDYVSMFDARYRAFADLQTMVRRWWDLPGLDRMYSAYVQAHEPVLTAWSRRRSVGPPAAFADHLRAADAWRRIPYLDPGLPTELVGADWSGTRASDIFFRLHAMLAGAALAHVMGTVTRRD